MKQFFGAFFGSLIGLIVATFLAIVLIVAVIKSSINDALTKDTEETSLVKANSILRITINGSLEDRDIKNPFEELKKLGQNSEEEGNGLNALLKKINYAKTDDNIKGIYLDLKNVEGGYANITELRNGLLDFKKSGKFIYSYAEYYGQPEYYLASVSNKLFLNPQGGLEFKGLSMSIMFYKNTFEKLGVTIQTFRHGKFKSAIEPLMLDKMSEANRIQSKTFLNSIWNTMLEGISAERKLSITDLNTIANNLEIESPESAIGKLIDVTAYEDEVLNELKTKLNITKKNKLHFVEINNYEIKTKHVSSANKIAVIYAVGGISGGEGNDEEIGSARISRAIKNAAEDEKIKAIVLRVNSPGGSALASDVIWREVTIAKKSKPVIVSMGNYAASGGYYIACAADRIFAQPNTITGSIGVFGFFPNIQKALEEKLGITVDTVNTNKYSTVGSAFIPVQEREREYIQGSIEKVYETFISRVAEGRKMKKNEVDSIGQGRVWTGKDALAINLVDELGGLNDAIAYAAKKANINEYKLIELPKPKNQFADFIGKTETEAETRIAKKNLRITYSYLKQIQNIISIKGVQARLPFEMIFE